MADAVCDGFVSERLSQLVDDFSFLDDWEARYAYLIDLGKQLPPLADEERCEANRVEGCMSQVWLVAETGKDGRVLLRGDSDAHIVRGLIAVLLASCSGLRREELAQVDLESVFDRLGFAGHISPNRRNGFFAMVSRIKMLSEQI